MLNTFRNLLITSSLLFSQIFSIESIPKYNIIDMGLAEFIYSEPIALNDNNQVLGFIEDYNNNISHKYFIWDSEQGISFPVLPPDARCIFLNNKGQIAGTYANDMFVFIWDPNMGFLDTGFYTGSKIRINSFNNLGDLILVTNDVDNKNAGIYFHSKNITTNINDLLERFSPDLECIQSFSSSPKKALINDNGELLLIGSNKTEPGINSKISLLKIKNSLIFKIDYNEENIYMNSLIDFDRFGNFIYGTNDTGYYFVKANSLTKFYCEDARVIINEIPHTVNQVAPILKQKSNGSFYYSNGISIASLFDRTFPYWPVDSDLKRCIKHKNSHGWVSGQMRTVYGNYAVFLAAPTFE